MTDGRSDHLEERLQAYHDGELSLVGRLLVEWRLRRDPAARRELETLRTMGTLLREIDETPEGVDLWDRIELRLPALDATRREEAERASPGPGRFGWVAAAAAAAAALLWFSVQVPDDEFGGAVRWLDAGDHPLVVLQDDRTATIIWLPDVRGDDVSGHEGERHETV